MKPLILSIAFCTLNSVLSAATITYYSWDGGTLADENNILVPAGGSTPVDYDAITILNTNLLPFVSDDGGGNFTIDIAHIPTAFAIQDLFVIAGPPHFGGYATQPFTDSAGAGIGDTAYLVVKKGAGAIQIGDLIGLGGNANIVGQTEPVSPPGQQISGGNIITNITVIPEPTTIAFLLAGLLGLLGFRKHFKK